MIKNAERIEHIVKTISKFLANGHISLTLEKQRIIQNFNIIKMG
jgi:hypothetical protein